MYVRRESLHRDPTGGAVDARELSQISEVLDNQAKIDSSLVEVADLKFFCGFTFGEIAAMKNGPRSGNGRKHEFIFTAASRRIWRLEEPCPH
jgi:hypothetical protein